MKAIMLGGAYVGSYPAYAASWDPAPGLQQNGFGGWLACGANRLRWYRVHGSMHYYTDQPFPKLVHVTSFETHPCDDELPTLAGLRGPVPGSTGELSVVDFVRSLRHDDSYVKTERSNSRISSSGLPERWPSRR